MRKAFFLPLLSTILLAMGCAPQPREFRVANSKTGELMAGVQVAITERGAGQGNEHRQLRSFNKPIKDVHITAADGLVVASPADDELVEFVSAGFRTVKVGIDHRTAIFVEDSNWRSYEEIGRQRLPAAGPIDIHMTAGIDVEQEAIENVHKHEVGSVVASLHGSPETLKMSDEAFWASLQSPDGHTWIIDIIGRDMCLEGLHIAHRDANIYPATAPTTALAPTTQATH